MSWDDIKKEHGGSAQSGGWEAVKAQWQAEAPARAMRQQAERERQKSALQLAERGAKTARDAADAIRNGMTRRQPVQAGRNGVGQDVDTLMHEGPHKPSGAAAHGRCREADASGRTPAGEAEARLSVRGGGEGLH